MINMIFDSTNYLNSIWSICYEIIKEQFSNYIIETEKLDISRVIEKPTILILHPRSNIINYGTIQAKKEFYLTIFCFDIEDGGASKITGEIEYFINNNKNLFSEKGLRNVRIESPQYIEDDSNLYGYIMDIQGFVNI